MTGPFAPLAAPPPDPLFLLYRQYLADPRPEKVNLGIGIYTAPDGSPVVLPAVQAAARALPVTNFNYDPIRGHADFLAAVAEWLFGTAGGQLAAQQTVGGTHALSLAAELFASGGYRHVLVGTPTWGNHHAVLGDLQIHTFSHLDDRGEPNLAAYAAAVASAPAGSVLLLHGGPTHNPTGRNLTAAEVATLAPEINRRGMAVLVDAAYLGFGAGLAADLAELRQLREVLENVAFAVSFSKNATLYRHRAGVLLVQSAEPAKVEALLQQQVRATISMPPGYGASVLLDVLTHRRSAWENELENARQDICHRRDALLAALPPQFAELQKCAGLFGLLPLTSAQISRLQTEFAIYLPSNGRINFGGLETARLKYVAESMQKVLATRGRM